MNQNHTETSEDRKLITLDMAGRYGTPNRNGHIISKEAAIKAYKEFMEKHSNRAPLYFHDQSIDIDRRLDVSEDEPIAGYVIDIDLDNYKVVFEPTEVYFQDVEKYVELHGLSEFTTMITDTMKPNKDGYIDIISIISMNVYADTLKEKLSSIPGGENSKYPVETTIRFDSKEDLKTLDIDNTSEEI